MELVKLKLTSYIREMYSSSKRKLLFTYGPNQTTWNTPRNRLDRFASLNVYTGFILSEWTIFLSSDQNVPFLLGCSSGQHSNHKHFINMYSFL